MQAAYRMCAVACSKYKADTTVLRDPLLSLRSDPLLLQALLVPVQSPICSSNDLYKAVLSDTESKLPGWRCGAGRDGVGLHTRFLGFSMKILIQ